MDLERTHHRGVEGQRRVDVDERGHHGVLCDKLPSEQDLAHLDGIPRARGFGDRAHERLVRQRHMREQHVEAALVHGHIGRLADRAAGMVQPFRHLAQPHEAAEILDPGMLRSMKRAVSTDRTVRAARRAAPPPPRLRVSRSTASPMPFSRRWPGPPRAHLAQEARFAPDGFRPILRHVRHPLSSVAALRRRAIDGSARACAGSRPGLSVGHDPA